MTPKRVLSKENKQFLQSSLKYLCKRCMVLSGIFRYTKTGVEREMPVNILFMLNVNMKGVYYYGKFIFKECLQSIS